MKISSTLLSRSAPKADLFVVGCFKGDKDFKTIKKTEPAFYKVAAEAVSKKRFEGKTNEVLTSFQTTYRQAPEVMLVGLGEKKDFKVASLRKTAGVLAGLANSRKALKVRVLLDSFLAEGISAFVK